MLNLNNLKKLAKSGSRIYLAPSWLSNGHFAIHRDRIEHKGVRELLNMDPDTIGNKLGTSVQVLTDDAVEGVLLSEEELHKTSVATITTELRQAGEGPYIRIFEGKLGRLGIDEDYVKVFEIGAVSGVDVARVLEVHPDVFVMPCRL